MKFYDSKIVQKRMSVFTLVAGCVCLLVAAVGGGLVLFGSPRVRVIGAVFAGIHAVIAAVLFVAFALWRRMLKKNALPQPGDVPRDLQNYGYIRLRLQGVSLLIAGVILLAGGLIAAFVLSGRGDRMRALLYGGTGLLAGCVCLVTGICFERMTGREADSVQPAFAAPARPAAQEEGEYRVTVTLPERAVRGEPFFVRVESENISGRTLESATCSTLYKRGTAIEVYTVTPAGEALYLQDEFLAVTLDYRVQEVLPGEVLAHDWKFDGTLTAESAEKNGGDGMAPAGKCFVRDYAGRIYSFELT